MNKPHIVIIEGCDKTGKSTLSHNLLENFGYEKYIHLGQPKKGQDMWDFHWEHILAIKESGKPTVIDRFHFSNIVYGKLLNHPHIDEAQVKKLEAELNALRTAVIYTWRDPLKIEESFLYDNEDLIKPSMIAPIDKEYWAQLYETQLPWTTYNFEVDGPMKDSILIEALKPNYE